MLKDLFKSNKKYATIKVTKKTQGKSAAAVDNDFDENIWMKCSKCNEMMLKKDYEDNLNVCPTCEKHGRLDAKRRLENIIDEDSFKEYYTDIKTTNPIDFPEYGEKLEKAKDQSGLDEAVITGRGSINEQEVNIGIMEPKFMMGSMGSVVGEKITRLIEDSAENSIPLVLFCASGGARMQEGILSLMQMAKTSAALSKLDDKKVLYITVLTDPTTGGVSASFAMLGDIIISEPETLIGFAGPRVVAQTIRQELPEGFQTAEFLLEKGFVDIISKRKDMKKTISDLIKIHSLGGE